jgi:hypothetical protein
MRISSLAKPISYSQRFHLPNDDPNAPNDRNQGKSLSHICGVRQFTNHRFHDSDVAIQYTTHDAAREATSVLYFFSSLKVYLTTRLQKFVERPKHSIEMQVPESPTNSTGLRPMRSDNRLQRSTVSACARKNSDSCKSLEGKKSRKS